MSDLHRGQPRAASGVVRPGRFAIGYSGALSARATGRTPAGRPGPLAELTPPAFLRPPVDLLVEVAEAS